ncbi:MAG: aminoacyl-histidine dipeptidase, partial [Bacteroidales bacterium]|nr:aminoacyl-histidine dipeptidase [Bacteroidales bacterium]
IQIPYLEIPVPEEHIPYKLSLTGLKGGHSGLDINLGRANANKLLFRFLNFGNDELDIHIASVSGGTLRNAIPREAFAVVMVPEDRQQAFLEAVKKYEKIFHTEYNQTEPDLRFTAEKTEKP